jgi:hypothetical protein
MMSYPTMHAFLFWVKRQCTQSSIILYPAISFKSLIRSPPFAIPVCREHLIVDFYATALLANTSNMSAYCAPCRRSFKEQKDLDMHTRNSFAHKNPIQRPCQGQDLVPVKVRSAVHKHQDHATGPQNKPVETQQTFNAVPGLRTTGERRRQNLPNGIASSSTDPQTTNSTIKIASQGADTPWSVIPESKYVGVLNALARHCHSLEELQGNGYAILPYNPIDYADSRKCKRCNSTFLV